MVIFICINTYYMKKKVTITIDEKLYNRFKQISEKLSINKSKFIENKIKEFIENEKDGNI
jgi:metal-responsive CopG/Arc/MetJ family transcriptional regulator